MQLCNDSKIHGRRGLSQIYAGSATQSIDYTILVLFSAFVFVLTVNLIILFNMRKDILLCVVKNKNILLTSCFP